MLKRSLLAAGAATALLTGPLVALPASADGATFRDPTGDAAAATDITTYFLGLNRDVVSATIGVRTFNQAVLTGAALFVDLDTTGDGESDFSLAKLPGADTADLYSYAPEAGEEPVADCPVALTYDAAGRSVTMSTTAACVGSPARARLIAALIVEAGDSIAGDVAPDDAEFRGGVSRGFLVQGAIAEKYGAVGGAGGFLGRPVTDETPSTRDGAYNIFEGGLVLWSQPTGAHFVRGAVRERWGRLGSEFSGLGYPATDEVPSARGGAAQVFEGGSVYWSPSTGAKEIYGAIREAWVSQGYEAGRLGFPISAEFDAADGRKQEFQGGNVVWTEQTGAVIAYPAA